MAIVSIEAKARALPFLLERDRKGHYLCPQCGRYTIWKLKPGCPVAGCVYNDCRWKGDAVNLLEFKGYSTADAFQYIHDNFEYSTPIVKETPAPMIDDSDPRTKAQINRWTQYCREKLKAWAAALPGSEGERYLRDVRLIDTDTQKRLMIGYDADERRVVFPTDRQLDYYDSRAIDPDTDPKVIRPSIDDGGPMRLYNGGALNLPTLETLFVVEGAIDAASILQGIWDIHSADVVQCVATGGKNVSANLLKALSECTLSKRLKIFVAFDNGAEQSEIDLCQKISGRIPCISCYSLHDEIIEQPYPYGKDFNDVLVISGRLGFAGYVSSLIELCYDYHKTKNGIDELKK